MFIVLSARPTPFFLLSSTVRSIVAAILLLWLAKTSFMSSTDAYFLPAISIPFSFAFDVSSIIFLYFSILLLKIAKSCSNCGFFLCIYNWPSLCSFSILCSFLSFFSACCFNSAFSEPLRLATVSPKISSSSSIVRLPIGSFSISSPCIILSAMAPFVFNL